MAKNITSTAAYTIDGAAAIFIQSNAAATANITITAGGVLQGTIVNPAVGSQFKYGGLRGQGAIVITSSAACDLSVTVINDIK